MGVSLKDDHRESLSPGREFIFFIRNEPDLGLAGRENDEPRAAHLDTEAQVQLFVEVGAGEFLELLRARLDQRDFRGDLLGRALFPD